MFEPIDKSSTVYQSRYYEVVIRSINDMINKGELRRGDKLPSERELAELFGVSRVPIREALKVLEFLGIVYKIPGEGMYIKDIEIATLLNKIFFAFQLDDRSIIELYEVRLLIETYSARQAAILRTEQDLKVLEQAVELLRDVLEKGEEGDTPDRERLTQASRDFHNGVVAASHNQLLNELYKFLFTLLNLSYNITHSELQYSEMSLIQHREILNCIQKNDADGAGAMMDKHLKTILEETKLKLNQKAGSEREQ